MTATFINRSKSINTNNTQQQQLSSSTTTTTTRTILGEKLRERILTDMFKSISSTSSDNNDNHNNDNEEEQWRILVLDTITTKVVSSCLGMADLLEECSITQCANVLKRREPQRDLECIYFIQPTNEESLKAIMNDWPSSSNHEEADREEEEDDINSNSNTIDHRNGFKSGNAANDKKLFTKKLFGSKKNKANAAKQTKSTKKQPVLNNYRAAHIFFSSPAPIETIKLLQQNENLIRNLKTCKEVYAEFLVNDSSSFSVDYNGALSALYGEEGRSLGECVDVCSTRLATMLSTIGELVPNIRYQKGVMNADGEIIGRNACEAVARQTEYLLSKMREKQIIFNEKNGSNASSSNLGSMITEGQTCEVLILDRSFDYVAPIIHEWTYEAIIHDLLNVPNSVYSYSINTNKGVEDKIAKLDEKDSLFVELRHAHVAKVMGDLFEKGRVENEATKKNADIKRIVQALPETLERRAKLSIHTSIAAELNHVLNVCDLTLVGRMEQMVAFGDATSKDIINLLSSPSSSSINNAIDVESNKITIEQTLPAAEKLRLLMIYAATHPEKIDEQEALKWIQASGLTKEDINMVLKLEQFGAKIRRTDQTNSKSTRMNRPQIDERSKSIQSDDASFDRFVPRIAAILRELDGGRNALSNVDFPSCSTNSLTTSNSNPFITTASNDEENNNNNNPFETTKDDDVYKEDGTNFKPQAKLGRWASHARNGSQIPFDIPSRVGTPDTIEDEIELAKRKKRKRLVVFVLGGVTRGEIREGFHVGDEFDRDVFIGGTSILNPEMFMNSLNAIEGFPLDAFRKTPTQNLSSIQPRQQLEAAANSPKIDPKELDKILSDLSKL